MRKNKRIRPIADDQILKAVEAANGNVSLAGRRLKVSSYIVSRCLDRLPADQFPECVLWHRLRAHPKRTSIRDALIERYLPQVVSIAGNVQAHCPPYVSRDDLESAGQLGLLDAVASYDHTRDVKFSTHAYARIRGAMLDWIRIDDQEARSTRSKQKARHKAVADLSHTLGRQPTEADVCEAMAWSPAKLQTSYPRLAVPLIEGRDVDYVARPTQPSPRSAALSIAHVTQGLPLEWRIVIYCRYAKGATLVAIAGVLGVGLARISQVHADAIDWLRTHRTRDQLLDVLGE